MRVPISLTVAIVLWSTFGWSQTATVTKNVNLRGDPSTDNPPIRHLTAAEPPLTLVQPTTTSGYYHVTTQASEDGWVWGKNVAVSTAPPNPPAGNTVSI